LDKFEYKVKSDEIKTLISEGEYQRAVEIADEIDWRRVKSVMMLCTISDLYKMVRRYEDSRDLLLLAYERHPGGRTIVFSLCELFIKMGDVYQAVEYYKEYVAVAPKDSGRYILQYKLYEAQDVSLEERIAVLEEMKRKDYREKWAYELAYLYHRVGLATKCVEECDELILWFGEGKYVVKAMELKMLHQPLSPEQQAKYDMQTTMQSKEEPGSAEQSAEEEIEVKQVGIGEYDTINLQKELAEGLREVLGGAPTKEEEITRSLIAPMLQETKNLPAEEILAQMKREAMDAAQEESIAEATAEETSSEVFFGETGEVPVGVLESLEWQASETAPTESTVIPEALAVEEPVAEVSVEEEAVVETGMTEIVMEEEPPMDTAGVVMEAMRMEKAAVEKAESVEPPRELQNVLSMESDGQLSLVVPESEAIEKQITGQISIEDVLAEWERMKKENEEKRKEEVRKRVLEQTGAMFTEFEAKIRDGLLEQLESGKITLPLTEVAKEVQPEPEEVEAVIEELEQEDAEDFVKELEEVEETLEEEENGEPEEAEEFDEAEETDELDEDDEDEEEFEELEDVEAAEEVDDDGEELEDTEEVEIEDIEEALEDEEFDEEPEAEEDLPEEEFEETQADELAEVEELTEDEEAAEVAEVEDVSEEELLEEITELPEEVDGNEQDIAETEETEDAEEIEEDGEETVDDEDAEEEASAQRAFTKEEKELFAPFVQGKASKKQLSSVLENITMAAYTGNVIVTGAEGVNTIGLAKNLVRHTQLTDGNFSGKTAKISASSLNTREVAQLIEELVNGALIIQKASDMSGETVEALYKSLQNESFGILVVLEDTKKAMDRFLEQNEQLLNCFTARMDVEALSDEALVAFGRKYARDMEYVIDDFGVLALHQRIDEMQTSDHVVTIMEVKEIVDAAIAHANRKSVGHFFDVLFSKRYDEEDMIILREKDFI